VRSARCGFAECPDELDQVGVTGLELGIAAIAKHRKIERGAVERDEIAGAYKLVLGMSGFDPQKVGKNETSCKIALSEFEKALIKEQNQAA
jgi:hypothetical protein